MPTRGPNFESNVLPVYIYIFQGGEHSNNPQGTHEERYTHPFETEWNRIGGGEEMISWGDASLRESNIYDPEIVGAARLNRGDFG